MTLVGAVTNILLRKVTEEEAKQFALNNYGELASYIRGEFVSSLVKPKHKAVRVNSKKK